MTSPLAAPTTPPPQLRPYQTVGVQFLRSHSFAILGDSMGLGKTPQAVTAAAQLIQENPLARVLIVAPAATLPGLAREVVRWSGITPSTIKHSQTKDHPTSGILLLAWTSAAKQTPHLIKGPRFAVVICDEFHRAKNPAVAVTKAVLGGWRKVDGEWTALPSLAKHADRIWALSGTPIPNRPIELQPMLHLGGNIRWAAKEPYGQRYCYNRNRFTPRGYDFTGARNLDELHAKIKNADILLRRLPEDLPPGELPTLTTVVVPLDGVREPTLSAGVDAAAVRAAVDAGDPIPFESMSAYRADMGLEKVPEVVDWVANFVADNPETPLVLFVWHKAVGEAILSSLMTQEKIPALFASGDHTPEQRQTLVDRFASGDATVFIGTIAACGVGLNGLHTRTTVCAFAEYAWTPGELVQAIGRVRRIGSVHDHTTAYLLVGSDSLEEYIIQTWAQKLTTIDRILGDSSHGL